MMGCLCCSSACVKWLQGNLRSFPAQSQCNLAQGITGLNTPSGPSSAITFLTFVATYPGAAEYQHKLVLKLATAMTATF